MSEIVWQRRDCVSAEIEGSLVLLDLESLVYHSLNSTAASVWELLETPQPVPQLVDTLCKRFRVTEEECGPSVTRLIELLTKSNLVRPQDAAA